MTTFSDYIIYADESGDHSLEKINPEYPIFCLALCVIKKSDYINAITPSIQKLKFDYWGHDKIVLHEHEIRKQEKDFSFLRANKKLREKFLSEVNQVVEASPFHVVSSVIKKDSLYEQYKQKFNPYYIALKICLDNICSFLINQGEINKSITCIFEHRGKQEDEQLELEFYRIVNNKNTWGNKQQDFKQINFEIKFAGKSHNSTGLQLADLIARPIGLKILRPTQANQAYDIILKKYTEGCENKVFPDG